jgi:hypothetical protein
MSAQAFQPGFEAPKMLLSWSAPTRRFEEKSKLWFAALIVVSLGVFAFLLLFQELLFGLLILSLGFFVFVTSAVRPPVVRYEIHNSGVSMAGKVYLWDDLESFFIEKDSNMLVVKTRLSFPSEITMIIEKGLELEVENVLLQYLPLIERNRVDYMATVDGFIGKLANKLPKSFTKKYVSTPDKKVTVEPEELVDTALKRTQKKPEKPKAVFTPMKQPKPQPTKVTPKPKVQPKPQPKTDTTAKRTAQPKVKTTVKAQPKTKK